MHDGIRDTFKTHHACCSKLSIQVTSAAAINKLHFGWPGFQREAVLDSLDV